MKLEDTLEKKLGRNLNNRVQNYAKLLLDKIGNWKKLAVPFFQLIQFSMSSWKRRRR